MMYSNYFSKPKKNANILRFTPPGFKYSIDIPFPGRVLPVCARCKKNYKTREHCRTKECHYGLPWTDTYICITLDSSCTTSDGRIVDGPFVAANGVLSQHSSQQQAASGNNVQAHSPTTACTAYQYIDVLESKTPSCGSCKEKNYTRTYCRTSKKHKSLPWSTVYVVLTLMNPLQQQHYNGEVGASVGGATKQGSKTIVESVDSSLVVNNDDLDTEDESSSSAKKRRKIDNQDTSSTNTNQNAEGGTDTENKGKTATKMQKKKDNDENDKANDITNNACTHEEETKENKDVNDEKDNKKDSDNNSQAAKLKETVHPSRTFLSTISVDRNVVEWLEYDPVQHASQTRMREEMNNKMQEDKNMNMNHNMSSIPSSASAAYHHLQQQQQLPYSHHNHPNYPPPPPQYPYYPYNMGMNPNMMMPSHHPMTMGSMNPYPYFHPYHSGGMGGMGMKDDDGEGNDNNDTNDDRKDVGDATNNSNYTTTNTNNNNQNENETTRVATPSNLSSPTHSQSGQDPNTMNMNPWNHQMGPPMPPFPLHHDHTMMYHPSQMGFDPRMAATAPYHGRGGGSGGQGGDPTLMHFDSSGMMHPMSWGGGGQGGGGGPGYYAPTPQHMIYPHPFGGEMPQANDHRGNNEASPSVSTNPNVTGGGGSNIKKRKADDETKNDSIAAEV